MASIKNVRLVRGMLLLWVIMALPSMAASNQIHLPAETAKLPESTLPGYQLARQKCMMCHSVDYIKFQPPGMSQEQWTAEVAKMKYAYGAMLNAAEIKSIGTYLAVVYGSVKASNAGVLSVAE